MKLYHYNKTPIDTLKTKRVQGQVSTQEIQEAENYAKLFQLPGSYIDHLSFFFDPIPSVLLGSLYGDFHSIWWNGNTIVEHVIDTEDLDPHLIYRVVESPEKLAYLDSLEQREGDEWLINYYVGLNAIQLQNGELGSTRDNLEHQIRVFQGRTAFFYAQAKTRGDWEANKMKYAACVPHLMLYPDSGIIPIREWHQVTIGSEERKPYAC